MQCNAIHALPQRGSSSRGVRCDAIRCRCCHSAFRQSGYVFYQLIIIDTVLSCSGVRLGYLSNRVGTWQVARVERTTAAQHAARGRARALPASSFGRCRVAWQRDGSMGRGSVPPKLAQKYAQSSVKCTLQIFWTQNGRKRSNRVQNKSRSIEDCSTSSPSHSRSTFGGFGDSFGPFLTTCPGPRSARYNAAQNLLLTVSAMPGGSNLGRLGELQAQPPPRSAHPKAGCRELRREQLGGILRARRAADDAAGHQDSVCVVRRRRFHALGRLGASVVAGDCLSHPRGLPIVHTLHAYRLHATAGLGIDGGLVTNCDAGGLGQADVGREKTLTRKLPKHHSPVSHSRGGIGFD